MKTVTTTEFAENLDVLLDAVTGCHEAIKVQDSDGRCVVVMSEREYNGSLETIHLLSTTANQARLDAAIEEMQSGKSIFINRFL